jgi:hypothetical protein
MGWSVLMYGRSGSYALLLLCGLFYDVAGLKHTEKGCKGREGGGLIPEKGGSIW